jgi:hypothetical protein
MVWLHTIRATITPELRFKGRILWKELARGFPCVGGAAYGLVVAGFILNVDGYEAVPVGLEDPLAAPKKCDRRLDLRVVSQQEQIQ